MTTDVTDPLVSLDLRKTTDPDTEKYGIHVHYNDDMTLECESDSLVGRTDVERGPAQKIAVVAPLRLEDEQLLIDPLMDVAWTPYVPEVTAQSGVYGGVTAAAAYWQIGRTVFMRYKVTVSAIGTAGLASIISLPVPPNIAGQTGSARDEVAGKQMVSYINPSGGLVHTLYDGTFTGNSYAGSFTYEVA